MAEFLIESTGRVVEAWAISRLQFEPKGWQREFRAALRDAVGSIPPTGRLRASYTSPDTSSVDAENVLFYNVGLSWFAHATRDALQFERGYEQPQRVVQAAASMQHYHRYEAVAAVGDFELWTPTAVLASVTDLAFQRPDDLMRVAPIWKRIRETVRRTPVAWTTRWFALHLVLRVPSRFRPSAAALVKPLIDGVVSGLQQHDGSRLEVVSELLGTQLSMAAADVSALLMRSEGSVFGSRRLVVTHGNGVQWLPGDDACVGCTLAIERGASRITPVFDALVLAVEPGPPPTREGQRRTGPTLIFDQRSRGRGR